MLVSQYATSARQAYNLPRERNGFARVGLSPMIDYIVENSRVATSLTFFNDYYLPAQVLNFQISTSVLQNACQTI
jgi:hypothetical protein